MGLLGVKKGRTGILKENWKKHHFIIMTVGTGIFCFLKEVQCFLDTMAKTVNTFFFPHFRSIFQDFKYIQCGFFLTTEYI